MTYNDLKDELETNPSETLRQLYNWYSEAPFVYGDADEVAKVQDEILIDFERELK